MKYNTTTNTFNVIENLTIENGRAFRATPLFWDDTALSIKDNIKILSMNIYPNPVKTTLNLGKKSFDNIEIYSLSGLLIKTAKNTTEVNVSDLAIGMYVIKVYSEDSSSTRKFIKE